MFVHRFILSGISLKDANGSPMFPGNPHVLLPCSSTPVGPETPSPIPAFWYCPRCHDDEGSSDMNSFEAQSRGFGTGCLRFVPPLLTTTQNSLPGVASLFRVGLVTHW